MKYLSVRRNQVIRVALHYVVSSRLVSRSWSVYTSCTGHQPAGAGRRSEKEECPSATNNRSAAPSIHLSAAAASINASHVLTQEQGRGPAAAASPTLSGAAVKFTDSVFKGSARSR